MKSKIFGAAAGRAMAVSTVMLIAVLLLAPDASAASKYKTLYNFSGGADGNASEAGLIFYTAGNLYGTTYNGGAYGEGTVFKLTPNGNGTWTETVLHSFGASSDGASPWASVILDDSGNLYGTTNHGGISDYGSVFELTPNADGSWSETTLYSFAGGADGTYPVGGVTLDATGRLFGMTTTGGKGKCRYLGLIGCGTVYMLVLNQDGTWTETVLYRFSGGKDGGYPDHNSPLFDSAGNLYGLARNGGLAGACSWGGLRRRIPAQAEPRRKLDVQSAASFHGSGRRESRQQGTDDFR